MPNIHSYFIYILECADNSYYISVTNDLDIRIEQHIITEKILKLTLLVAAAYPLNNICALTIFNKQSPLKSRLKCWNRKKKETLFKDDWKEIVRLSNLKG
ncbi:putative endonuclease [Pedobacter sp. UYEF25]